MSKQYNWQPIIHADLPRAQHDPYEEFRRLRAENELHDVYPTKNNNSFTLDDDIVNERKKQRNRDASSVLKFLQSIGAAGHHTIWKAMAKNLPDIEKYHEWHQNKDKTVSVDWYDLKGKSDQHLKWDYKYWKNVATGYNQNNKDYDNAAKHYLYHENKLVADQTKPKSHKAGILHQEDAISHYQHLMNANSDFRVNSWLKKVHDAQFRVRYHQNKINDWTYTTANPKVTKRQRLVLKTLKVQLKKKLPRVQRKALKSRVATLKLKLSKVKKTRRLLSPKYRRKVKQQYKLLKKWKRKLKFFNKQKNGAMNHANIYLRELQHRHQQAIDDDIERQVKINDENHLTSIYRADRQDPTVIGVSELSPTEEMGMDLPTQSIDKQMPEGDYANVSELQLSGTYYVFVDPSVGYSGGYAEDTSPSYRNRVHQYNILRRWASQNKRVVVKGFTWWSSTMIQTISRTMDTNGAANSLQLGITFQYQRVAKIAMAKQKAATKRRKGRARKHGRHSNHTYKVRHGDSIYKIAHGNTKQVHAIIKANPSLKSHPNLIYPGNKLVIPK